MFKISESLEYYSRHTTHCFSCLIQFDTSEPSVVGNRFSCPKCKQDFCAECDLFVHEVLHNCPGCWGIGRAN